VVSSALCFDIGMAASKTAAYVALYRALETRERARPPLFRDPFALRFLPLRYQLLVRAAFTPVLMRRLHRYADARAPGARSSAIARTLFIDDVVRSAVARGVRQCVLLGAGFDCRAHRLPELSQVHVFEVDRKDTQRLKRSRVPEAGVRYVPVDFLQDDSFALLGQAGWDAKEPTLFVWEGVTNYLREEAVRQVLREVGRSACGSSIVFTYVHRGAIDGSVRFAGAQQILQNVRSMREPWTFGLAPEEVEPFVKSAGLRLESDLGADDYRARYLPSEERGNGYAFYRIAVASPAPSN
jgi:methyltransferase (TIGR00027 family)